MISKLQGLIHWFRYTSLLLGMVLLPYFLLIIAGKSWAEVMCKLMDRGCAYSWTYDIGSELQAVMAREGEVAIRPRK